MILKIPERCPTAEFGVCACLARGAFTADYKPRDARCCDALPSFEPANPHLHHERQRARRGLAP